MIKSLGSTENIHLSYMHFKNMKIFLLSMAFVSINTIMEIFIYLYTTLFPYVQSSMTMGAFYVITSYTHNAGTYSITGNGNILLIHRTSLYKS